MITNQHEIREITSFCLSVGDPQASKSGIFKIYTLAKPQKRQCSQKRATYTHQKRFRASSKFSISVGDLQGSKSGGATPRNDHKPRRNSRNKLIFRWGSPGLRIRKRDASELITNQHEIREITSFWLSAGDPQALESGGATRQI